MTEAEQPKRQSPRRGLLIAGCLTPILLAALVLGFFFVKFRGRSVSDIGPVEGLELENMNARIVTWASPPFVYDGPGRLDAYMSFGCRRGLFQPDPARGMTIGGQAVECKPPITSRLAPSPRTLLVHLPQGYDPNGPPLPVVFAFHGFGQRPHHVARALVDKFDQAEAAGALPPVVLVLPDMSISGNGADDLGTLWDDTGGSWGVNSNLGRFADHFTEELLPWVLEHYNVRRDPAGAIVLGGSMGGTIALNLAISDPRRFPNVGAFYPGLDMRYACDGDRTADYDPACYRQLTDDQPGRAMVVNKLQARTFNEKNLLFPVFDSDRWKGPVWRENKAVWQRVREHNPLDRLKDEKPDLRGVHIWYIVGDNDDFNIDAQAAVFNPVVLELGADLAPEDHIRPGRHDIPFIRENLDDAIAWIVARLQAGTAQ